MRRKPGSDLEKHKDTQSPLAEQRETHFLVRAFEMAVGSCFGQLFLQGLWKSVDGLCMTKKTSLTLLDVGSGGY